VNSYERKLENVFIHQGSSEFDMQWYLNRPSDKVILINLTEAQEKKQTLLGTPGHTWR
jgi:hypothetical protein